MPDAAKNLTDELLRRVRDVHGLAHTREFARTVLSQSQQVLNTLLAIKLTATTLTTYPFQQFYTINGLLTGTDAITRVVAVRDGGKMKIIRFGDQKMGHNYSDEARKSFKARHAKNIKKGKTSAAYWANKMFWSGKGGSKKSPPKSQKQKFGK